MGGETEPPLPAADATLTNLVPCYATHIATGETAPQKALQHSPQARKHLLPNTWACPYLLLDEAPEQQPWAAFCT